MLQEGDKAPNFKGKDQNGDTVQLADFKGKKLILFFYPKDDTPGCTATACNLRDNNKELLKKGFAIVGISADDEASHRKFADKYNLPFPLIADTDKKMLEAYEAWGEKNLYGKISTGVLRKTYVIDENGVIEKIFKRVQTDNHTEQILNAVSA
ncbi:MAG TPA: thioredoxin-dependent thiol peroxidase [Chitinophagales bacterium]|nr:thioredoxin-dependent thiol peroxidase [Chitinophagales bacterium]